MKIVIETAPFASLRHGQVDDYWRDADGTLQIRVAPLSNDRRTHGLVVHALWEALTCLAAGVPFSAIDAWDAHYTATGEPGDDPHAPYYRRHQSATIIERLFLESVEEHWADYAREIDALGVTPAAGKEEDAADAAVTRGTEESSPPF
jgi:hypothetical protein